MNFAFPHTNIGTIMSKKVALGFDLPLSSNPFITVWKLYAVVGDC